LDGQAKGHDRKKYTSKEQIDHHRDRGAGQKLPNRFEFTHSRDRVSDTAGLEVCQRQRQQMSKELRPETDINAIGGVREQVRA
jgi:hypothetical protein